MVATRCVELERHDKLSKDGSGARYTNPQVHAQNPITRLVGAILLEQNDEWAVSRRYMTLESIAQTSDNLTLKLPTVAA